MSETVLPVQDADGVIEIGFDDLKQYHGTKSICGLSVSFKIMQAAWSVLSGGGALAREDLTVESGFPGPGARDGFEMATRAASRGAYHIIKDAAPSPLIAEAAKGAYFFRFSTPDAAVEFGLKPEALPADFVPLRRRLLAGEADAGEQQAFRRMQFEFSEKILAAEIKDAVNVLSTGAA